MAESLKEIHNYIKSGNSKKAQELLRKKITKPINNPILTSTYILKAYEIAASNSSGFRGLTETQLKAHELIVRQLLIENDEELNRRVSQIK